MAPKEQGPEDEYWSQWPRCTTCCTHHPAQEHLPALTTMHDVQQEYTAIEASWRKSDCRPRFHDMLTSKRPPSGWQITEAISLGIGSFTEYSCGLFDRRCSMMQFIVFMDTVRFLEAGNVTGATIEISSQDPRYMDLDRDFLRSLGVVVLERPEAEERIKKASFTYMPRVCDAQVLIKSQPALHIGWGITSGIRQNERFFHEDETGTYELNDIPTENSSDIVIQKRAENKQLDRLNGVFTEEEWPLCRPENLCDCRPAFAGLNLLVKKQTISLGEDAFESSDSKGEKTMLPEK